MEELIFRRIKRERYCGHRFQREPDYVNMKIF